MSSAESLGTSAFRGGLCSWRPSEMRPVSSANVHEAVVVVPKSPPRMTMNGVSVATLLDLARPRKVDRSVGLDECCMDRR